MSENRVPGDVAAEWNVHLPDGIHKVEFEHGTTSGKRVVRVDDKEISRTNWMFSLVGQESFKISGKPATVTIESKGFTYYYTLSVCGQTLKQFIETQNKSTRTWLLSVRGESQRIVLDVKTMDVYVNGELVNTVGEFVDEGSENHFTIGSIPAYIKTLPSGQKRKGLLYRLVVDGGEDLEPVIETIPQ